MVYIGPINASHGGIMPARLHDIRSAQMLGLSGASLRSNMFTRLLKFFIPLLFMGAYASQALGAETPQTLRPDTMEARVAACVHCHGADGRSAPDGFYPRIAGKPAGYLYAQLLGFRDGGRSYEPMHSLLQGLPNEYLAEIAQYFADMRLPYARPARSAAPREMLDHGRTLVEIGDTKREIPACATCHGANLSGREPHIPGLLGLPRDYIAAQLGSWRTGLRHAPQPDCMAQVAEKLSPADVAAVSAWLASLTVTEPYLPAAETADPLPLECGTTRLPGPNLQVEERRTGKEGSNHRPANERIETGRYLARAANCVGCHTTEGGVPFAGGFAITTRFGTLYGSNITPSPAHGIGNWSADDFWSAMHEGKAPDGSPLYPAFPYPQYTHITREDADAIFAYLMSLPADDTPSRPHELRFPYNQRSLLTLWRALYFTPGSLAPESAQSEQWHRGRYLVEATGHCAACHTPRNQWGASDLRRGLQGADMPDMKWFATPLTGDANGLANWSENDIVELLQTGSSRHGTAAGPMGSVVTGSTQHLQTNDLQAIAHYLKSLPAAQQTPPRASHAEHTMVTGARLYEQHCTSCHGDSGEGAPPAWPPLAGNASVLASSSSNVVLSILQGGYAPATQSNPRPHGMPPFHALSDSEIAALATYIRNSWGNSAGPVSPHQVAALR